MKLKKVAVVTIAIFIIGCIYGTVSRSSYKDFNAEEVPLTNFVVACLSDELLDLQLSFMSNTLDNSNIILRAEATEGFKYRFSCTTQEICVKEVFKGKNINAGDTLHIARASSHIFSEKDMRREGKLPINMGFVNEMIPGKEYLVFLDKKFNTKFTGETIYIQSEEYLIAPIFCYDSISNISCRDLKNENNQIPWDKVSSNEFFMETPYGIKKIQEFKYKLINKYKKEDIR